MLLYRYEKDRQNIQRFQSENDYYFSMAQPIWKNDEKHPNLIPILNIIISINKSFYRWNGAQPNFKADVLLTKSENTEINEWNFLICDPLIFLNQSFTLIDLPCTQLCSGFHKCSIICNTLQWPTQFNPRSITSEDLLLIRICSEDPIFTFSLILCLERRLEFFSTVQKNLVGLVASQTLSQISCMLLLYS